MTSTDGDADIDSATREPVVDAQVHIWAESTPERPWSETIYPIQRIPPLGVDELQTEMIAAHVDRAILVPPMWEGPRNDLALAAARRQPDTFAVMGRLKPTNEDDLARLQTWRDEPGMLGVRVAFNRGDTAGDLRDAVAAGFFVEAAATGVPIMIYAPGLCDEVAAIGADNPKLRLIIDHVALTEEVRETGIKTAIEPVLAVCGVDNIAVKASALPCYTKESYPFPSLEECVHRLIDAFGARRVFWGSDYSRLPCTYRQWHDAFTGYVQHLSEFDRGQVMGAGIVGWLGWPLSVAS